MTVSTESNSINGHDPDVIESAVAVPSRYVADVLCRGLSNRVRRKLGMDTAYVAVDDLVALGLLADDQRPTEDAVDIWCQREFHTGLNLYAKTLPSDALRGTVTGHDPRRRIAGATVQNLAEAGVPWAVSGVAQLRDANTVASADRRTSKALALTVADMLDLGAPQSEIDALPSADVRSLAASVKLIDTWAEAEKLERRRDAVRIESARAAAEIAIPERVDLGSYVPEAVRWTVDQLIGRGAVLGLFAERKAGKTTVVRELVRAVLSGEPFLGRFAVAMPTNAEVVLFDTEMPLTTLHTQYTRADVDHLDRLNLRPLRGVERSLDVRVDAVRTRWREQIAPGSLIVVDCLYTLFGALGVSENSDEVVEVLAGLRTLATECDAAGLVIVHHLGKDAERGARGHSSIEGFPDAIARIELDGAPSGSTPHVFSAYGRDVSVDAGLLTLGDDHRLTLGGNPKAERIVAAHRANDDAVWRLIDKNPGLSVRGLYTLPIESRGKLSRDRIREAVERMALINRVVNKGSESAPEWHAIEGVDPLSTPAFGEV